MLRGGGRAGLSSYGRIELPRSLPARALTQLLYSEAVTDLNVGERVVYQRNAFSSTQKETCCQNTVLLAAKLVRIALGCYSISDTQKKVSTEYRIVAVSEADSRMRRQSRAGEERAEVTAEAKGGDQREH